ncbi:MAG: hypothetical protein IH795_05610 [Bacteroidetes bacterium]|nr:hypothetical protein [Bacteroidota bacterium]
MKPYIKNYFKVSGIDPYGFVPCEVCEGQCVDFHHIESKGMGGDPTKEKDKFKNIMAICRTDHEKYGDLKQWKNYLKALHAERFPHILEFNHNTGEINEKI